MRTLLISLLLLTPPRAQDKPEAVKERMKKSVEFLASETMKGREAGSQECEKAARWMADEFQKIGLKKGTPDGYLQKFQSNGKDAYNVVGLLEGSSGEHVLIGCHHDHLGVKEGKTYNGANDNASGCAVVLECARLAVAAKQKPRRGILFCSFDAEERGAEGSRHFVESPVFAQSKIVAMICLDMVGGDLFAHDSTSLYALGTESSPELRQVLGKQPKVEGLDVPQLGIAILDAAGMMSDYASFRDKGIPFVFMSSGASWTYHQPEDDVERLNLDKMERAVRYVGKLTLDIANLDARPKFVKQEGPTVDDLKTIAGIVKKAAKHPEDLDLQEKDLTELNELVQGIEKIVKAGKITEDDQLTLQQAGLTLMMFATRRPKGQK